MANDIKITITNAAQIKAAFDRAPGLMAISLNKAIYKTLLTIQGKSMINTPVKTSRLRSSTRTKMGNLSGEVGTHTKYDIFVHNGTRYMPARPYLKDAVDESNSAIQRNFKEAVDNVLTIIGKAT